MSQSIAIHEADQGIVRTTDPRGILRNGIQHWLQIRWRASDHAQDLARCGLLLQSLAKF